MKERMVEMSDGVSIYTFIEKPKKEPIGHIHLLHGMAEHIGRYELAIRIFVAHGYIVSGHDHRGHGRTAHFNGRKGHFADVGGFQRVVDDVLEITHQLRSEHPHMKFILLGHSMGSFIGRRFIQLYGEQVNLAIFSGTGDEGISRYAGQTFAHLFGMKNGYKIPNEFLFNIVFNRFNRKIDDPFTAFDWLSKNLNIVTSYMTDEYCGFIPTTQFFVDLFEGLARIHQKTELARIPTTLPILLFSGTEDPVGRNGKGVWNVAKQYDEVGMQDVTVLLFESGRHEILNDSTRPEVINTVLKWIEKR